MAIFPTKEQIQDAAERLRRGELVAFPTETVYGLGAHALDVVAVERIFAAKRRPRTSPLIVHVASVEAARELVTEWPEAAQRLADRFWPGPLSLVLPKRAIVPDLVTAGFPAVAIRIPRHPVALELLREAAVPVAAPSANLFTRLSPTLGSHVVFDGVMVLDGGESEVGIESTVLTLAGSARLLRPGAVSRSMLEEVIGPVMIGASRDGESPGLHPRHYQPSTLLIWAGDEFPAGTGAYLYTRRQRRDVRAIRMPNNPDAYASRIYRVLHELDEEGLDWIAVERLPGEEVWAALQDRLNRAAAQS